MTGFFAFMGLALFWVGFITLVKREGGWVGVSDFARSIIRFNSQMHRLAVAFAEVLTPVMRRTAKAVADWVEAAERTRA